MWLRSDLTLPIHPDRNVRIRGEERHRLKSILRFLRPVHWALLALMAVFVSVQVWFDLEIPGYMTKITVLLESDGTTEQIINEGLAMVICSTGSVICSICAGGVAAYVAAEFAKIIRREQFLKVQSFSPQEMSRFNIYSLITRSTNRMMESRTSFVIAHRLSTIIDADMIIVMSDRDIVETGRHEELLAKGGAYKELFDSQFDVAE